MKVRLLALAVAVCLLFSGCNVIGLDVENQLIPPQNDKEQNAMQTALYDHLQNYDFTLTYPIAGEYQAPFIVLNQIKQTEIVSGQTGSETVTPNSDTLGDWGIAFYRLNLNNAKTKIHLLKKSEDGVWKTVADVEGYSENVAEVNFADLNGDGFPELLVGWNMYNSTDKRLAIYRVDRKLSEVAFEKAYTELRCADMTDDGMADLVLLNVNSGQSEVKAQLYSYVKNKMQYRGETFLDGGIKRIGSSVVAALSPTVNGIFVDCQKDADTTVTELIYWNNSTLESPLSDEQSNLNTVTARENGLSCQDFDGDGAVEWPVSKRLNGNETAIWYTDWMTYDFRSAETNWKIGSIVNLTDSYMLRLRNEWNEETVTFAYDHEAKILSVCKIDSDIPFLQLLATHSETKIDLPKGFSYFDGLDTWQYAVWVDGDTITLEEAQYLFVVL